MRVADSNRIGQSYQDCASTAKLTRHKLVGSLRIELSYFALQANAEMTTLAHFPLYHKFGAEWGNRNPALALAMPSSATKLIPQKW